MNEDLKYTFGNVNEWLKFAEAKNAGLFALNAASIIGVIQVDTIFTKEIKVFEGIIIILFCISTCICFYTILPILNKWFRFYKKLDQTEFDSTKSSINALFFADIAKLSSDQFIELFNYKHGTQLTPAEEDFANQITNNSEITLQKFKLFSIASWFSFSAFVLAIVLVIIKTV